MAVRCRVTFLVHMLKRRMVDLQPDLELLKQRNVVATEGETVRLM